MKSFVTILVLLLLGHLAPAQTVVDLPDDMSSSGNDGVGGIEKQPPGTGGLPQGNQPGGPVGPQLRALPPTPAGPNDLQAGRLRDLGGALPGRDGAPRATLWQDAQGELAQLRLTSAAPEAPVTLVIGLAPVELPFKGGTLVPTPDLLIGLLHADQHGTLGLSATPLAELPGHTTLFLQFWVLDAAGPAGFAASNALMLVTGRE